MSLAVSTDQAHESGLGPCDQAREADLWSDFARGKSADARAGLFECHRDFAESVARRYHRKRNRGDLDLGELKQLAYAGLLEAIDRFDPGRGVPFRGYAARRVVGSVVSGVAKMSDFREQLSWRGRLHQDRLKSLRREHPAEDRSAVEDLADLAAGLAIGFMLEGTDLFRDPASPRRLLPSSVYESAAWNELLGRLRRELIELPERERDMIRNHYLADMSFEQIAGLMSLSKGRVSQLHHAALQRLAKRLGRYGHRGLEREGYEHG